MKQSLAALQRFGVLAALLFFTGAIAVAQTTISGTIVDPETDEPLIGANVLVVGTSTGTITDYDGNYELTLPEGAEQIRVSYTGYSPQTIAVVPGQTTYDVELTSGELLEEVVVIGYGSTTQSEVTSAVTSVKEDDFNQGVVNNPTQLVQGKVAGLQISTPSGDPNQQPVIRLRGLSTLGANVEPLIIIDGVIGADLSTIDPSDIASVDVLKDGSAAAIYGTRAASGVIIYTTKRAAPGETTVSYNVQGGLEQFANGVDVASAEEYLDLRGGDGENIDFGERNDVYDLLTRNALSQIHNLSVTGGTENTSFRASLNYRDVEGVAVWSEFEQLNARLNVRQTAFDDMLTFDLTGSITSRESEEGYSAAFRYAPIFNPTIPLNPGGPDRTEDGFNVVGGFSQVDQFDYFNPLMINRLNSNELTNRQSLLSGIATLRPVDGLEIQAQYSVTSGTTRRDRYSQRTSNFPIGIGANINGAGSNGFGNLEQGISTNNLFEATASYGFDATSDLPVEFLVGYSYQELENEFSTIQAGNSLTDAVGTDGFGFYQDFNLGRSVVFSGGDRQELESFFGRVKLDYDDFLYLQASIRNDGSTRFGRDEKRGWFPAVSGGVDVGRFVTSPDINTIKLRAGYGVTGNLPGQSLLSQFLFTQGGAYPIAGPGQYAPAAVPLRNANSGLRFERKGELNVGLDLAFLDYRLTAAFDYFRRNTTDLIDQINVPPGGQSPNGDLFFNDLIFANLDDVALQNNGFEATVGYDVLQSETFSWTPRVVFSSVRTSLEATDSDDLVFRFFAEGQGERYLESTSPGAPGQNQAPTQVIRVGEELGQIYTYVPRGVTDDGLFIFEDLNGDGQVEILQQASPDKEVVGFGLPDFTLGLQNQFYFGDFDASIFFRGDFGHSLENMPRNFYENLAPTRGTDNVVVTDYFDPNIEESRFNARYVEEADFVVLDNASIGYNIPISSDSRIKSVRVGLAGRNLFYITNYTGVSPEVRYVDTGQGANPTANGNILAPGIDRRNNYIRTRSFNLQANITF